MFGGGGHLLKDKDGTSCFTFFISGCSHAFTTARLRRPRQTLNLLELYPDLKSSTVLIRCV